MSTTSKITLGNTDFDLRDADAQEQLTQLKSDLSDIGVEEFKARNPITGLEVYLSKKIKVVNNAYTIADDDDYNMVKIPAVSPVFLFNHDIDEEIAFTDTKPIGTMHTTIQNYYNNGLNSLSSYYTKAAKSKNGYIVVNIAKTDFDDFTIQYFTGKPSTNNNLITETLPFEIYGNVSLRYNANYAMTNIITIPGYPNYPSVQGLAYAYACEVGSDYSFTGRTAYDYSRWYNNPLYDKQSYVFSFPVSAGDGIAITAENYRNAPSYTDLYKNEVGSDALSLTASRLKLLPEHTSYYWKDKFFSFLGDSLTADAPYYPYLTRALNLKNYKNNGIGGTTMEGTGTNCMNQDGRINAIPDNTDVIIIMAGTNGSGALGDLTIENSDISTFIGAFNVCLSKIYYRFGVSSGYYQGVTYTGVAQVANPRDVQIIIITPPYLHEHSGQLVKVRARGAALKEMCMLWGLPCIDSIPLMQTNVFNDSMAFGDYTDPTHYNVRNRTKLADAIIGKLRELECIAESYV